MSASEQPWQRATSDQLHQRNRSSWRIMNAALSVLRRRSSCHGYCVTFSMRCLRCEARFHSWRSSTLWLCSLNVSYSVSVSQSVPCSICRATGAIRSVLLTVDFLSDAYNAISLLPCPFRYAFPQCPRCRRLPSAGEDTLTGRNAHLTRGCPPARPLY